MRRVQNMNITINKGIKLKGIISNVTVDFMFGFGEEKISVDINRVVNMSSPLFTYSQISSTTSI